MVALLWSDDSQHANCLSQAAEISGLIYTSWAVVTEAAWLLRKIPNGLELLLKAIADRDFVYLDLDASAANWLIRQARVYASLAPQLADLSLVYLAHQYKIEHVFTLDRRDFTALRSASGKSFTLLPAVV